MSKPTPQKTACSNQTVSMGIYGTGSISRLWSRSTCPRLQTCLLSPASLSCNSMKTGPKTDPTCLLVLRNRQLRKIEAPMEIPPEDVQEYMDIMDWLERPPQSFTAVPTENEEENSGPEQEGEDFYSDAGVLSYIDELCSQKHFIEQVSCTWSPGAGQILSLASQSL
ncbi:Protein FAM22 [Cricetulus griseus]|uniref:Protein FAM22 n=1 Tax=Cricetulus griseus TaxID=10029 RepID=G3IHE7_CRIGR|nr:Protein FAM22 [Cricetulus griseus]